jgi:hypothetical protein
MPAWRAKACLSGRAGHRQDAGTVRARRPSTSSHAWTSLVILAILAAMILGMSHRHDRRNHSRHDVRRDHRHHRHDLPGHWHYPGDDPRQPSEMIDHQNHSRADHHDGAPGTIPMTIRPSFPRRSSETISEPARTSIRNQPDQGSQDRVAGVAVFVGVGGTGRAQTTRARVRGSTGRATRATPPTGREAIRATPTLPTTAFSAPEKSCHGHQKKISTPEHPACHYMGMEAKAII